MHSCVHIYIVFDNQTALLTSVYSGGTHMGHWPLTMHLVEIHECIVYETDNDVCESLHSSWRVVHGRYSVDTHPSLCLQDAQSK